MIFYFTATGNSLYVAKQLDDECISIPQVINEKNKHYMSSKIGVVCPVFGHEVPEMVKTFLQESDFDTDYFYMILTYGRRHGGAAELAQQLLNNCGIIADYINVMHMVDNYLPAFDMDEERKIDKKIDEQIMFIQADLKQFKRAISPVTEIDRAGHREFLARNAEKLVSYFKEMYYITDECNGCAICTKVCPVNCFKIENGKAVRNPADCLYCMACIHHCSQKAIQLTIPEKNSKARYRNENITLAEIIQANEQKNKKIVDQPLNRK